VFGDFRHAGSIHDHRSVREGRSARPLDLLDLGILDLGGGSISIEPESKTLSDKQLERLNCARDFFGDPVKRWNDWLALVRSSKHEAYTNGYAAFVLKCRVPSVGHVEFQTTRSFRKDWRVFNDEMFIILKADAPGRPSFGKLESEVDACP
jgi:hypothetical protein